MAIRFAQSVGVAPGTTTVQFAGATVVMNPYQRDFARLAGLGAPITSARIRWDLIGLVGGGSFVVALTVGLIASALGK